MRAQYLGFQLAYGNGCFQFGQRFRIKGCLVGGVTEGNLTRASVLILRSISQQWAGAANFFSRVRSDSA